jgi:hypothetical protein
MLERPVVTAVIPAFNEAARITETIRGVAPFVDEIIVIDDGSRDNTADVAQAAGARVLRQPANQGYLAAIKRGFAEASGSIVVTVDADGEFPAARIPDLVQPIRAGQADMVQGSRNFVPRPSERVLNWLAHLRAPVGDSGTGFRALRTELARRLQIQGACICGIFALEVVCLGGKTLDVPITLAPTDKPRRVAWYHVRQFFYLLPWLFRRCLHESERMYEQ